MLRSPPVSITVHSMLTCPEPFESAPYFPHWSRLRAAPWSTSGIAGVKRSVGPSHRNAVAGERLVERAVNRIAIPAFLVSTSCAVPRARRRARNAFRSSSLMRRENAVRKKAAMGSPVSPGLPPTMGCKDRSPFRRGSGTARVLGRHGRPPLVVLCPPTWSSGAAPSFGRRVDPARRKRNENMIGRHFGTCSGLGWTIWPFVPVLADWVRVELC
jgi:hypothetical protein